MATASEILSTIAPQFDSEVTRQGHLDLAEASTNSTYFGAQRSRAVALRAAHSLKLATDTARNGDAGQISSKREGDLGISFGTAKGSGSGYLQLTAYGQELAALIAAYPSAGVTGLPFVLANPVMLGRVW